MNRWTTLSACCLAAGAALFAALPAARADGEAPAATTAPGHQFVAQITLLKNLDRLHLTAAQMREIVQRLSTLSHAEQAYTDREAEMAGPLLPELKRVEAALQAAKTPDPADQAKVDAILTKLEPEERRLEKLRIDTVQAIRQQLSRKQLTILRSITGARPTMPAAATADPAAEPELPVQPIILKGLPGADVAPPALLDLRADNITINPEGNPAVTLRGQVVIGDGLEGDQVELVQAAGDIAEGAVRIAQQEVERAVAAAQDAVQAKVQAEEAQVQADEARAAQDQGKAQANAPGAAQDQEMQARLQELEARTRQIEARMKAMMEGQANRLQQLQIGQERLKALQAAGAAPVPPMFQYNATFPFGGGRTTTEDDSVRRFFLQSDVLRFLRNRLAR